MADPTVLGIRLRYLHVDGIPTDSFAIVAFKAGDENLSIGNTPVFLMYFTGLSLGRMPILPYTAFNGDRSGVFIAGVPGGSAVRIAQRTFVVEIIEQSAPPFIALEETVVRAVAGSTIQIPIAFGSSLGLETAAAIESIVGVDDSQTVPANSPVIFTEDSPRIEWATSQSDIQVWRLKLRVTDSNNQISQCALRFNWWIRRNNSCLSRHWPTQPRLLQLLWP
ncbi:MAG: hypothetical protein IPH59_01330 [bacterium]|nr:hypothetical protein [bacterium]